MKGGIIFNAFENFCKLKIAKIGDHEKQFDYIAKEGFSKICFVWTTNI